MDIDLPPEVIISVISDLAAVILIDVAIGILFYAAISVCLCAAVNQLFGRLFASLATVSEKPSTSSIMMFETKAVNEHNEAEIPKILAIEHKAKANAITRFKTKHTVLHATIDRKAIRVPGIRNKSEDKATIPRDDSNTGTKRPTSMVDDVGGGACKANTRPAEIQLLRSWLPIVGSEVVVSPGKTFIIRSVSSGRVPAEQDGHVRLMNMTFHDYCEDFNASAHWTCIEKRGWLRFRNQSSGKFLGYDNQKSLVCVADGKPNWERFVVRQRPEGGNFLLGAWLDLCYVGRQAKDGYEKLGISRNGVDGAIVWHFIQIRGL